MNQIEFIKQVLIEETKGVLDKHKYLSFVLMVSGIELLGICIENPKEGFFERGHSGTRFRRAVQELFPDKYKVFNSSNNDVDLYAELRCGLAHTMLMKSKIGLSERRHNETHLSIKKGLLVLVAEDFFEDYKSACEKVIKMIENGEISSRFAMSMI